MNDSVSFGFRLLEHDRFSGERVTAYEYGSRNLNLLDYVSREILDLVIFSQSFA